MKSIIEFIKESKGDFNPKNPKHKEAYNDLLKWVDEQDKKGTLHGEEYYGILEYALKQWKNDNFNDLD